MADVSKSSPLRELLGRFAYPVRAREGEPRTAEHLRTVKPDYIRPIVQVDGVSPNAGVDLILDANGRPLRLYAFDVDPSDLTERLDLGGLELVSIHGGSFRDLGSLSAARNLVSLYLGGGVGLTAIPASVSSLPELVSIVVEDVEGLQTPPPEIARQGLDAIRNYQESIASSQELDYLHEAKMVVVGRGFVGKTSLVRKLVHPKARLERHVDSTEGIAIDRWALPYAESSSGDFVFNIWDFAGQEKYDATHQFFLTERTVYLFVTEARQESNFLDFDYWLSTLAVFAGSSPVIVVQNKIDERSKRLPTERYRSQFPAILDFIDVSCADGYEHTVEQLRSAVRRAIELLPQVGQELPKSWVEIRRDLQELDADHIPYESYVELCQTYGLRRDQADFLCRYFHDLGAVVHYERDLLLRRTVIVDPEWAVDGTYEVLDSPVVENNNGKFSIEDASQIWSSSRFRERADELLKLMENYGLCFGLGSEPQMYIAPELLSPNPPTSTIRNPFVPHPDSLQFRYRFDFMPAGTISRFIVKSHLLIEEENCWATGVILRSGEARALIEQVDIDKEVAISIVGPSTEARDLLSSIRTYMRDVINEFSSRVAYREEVPCACTQCSHPGSTNIHYFDWSALMRHLDERIATTRCDQSLEVVEVESLISSVEKLPPREDTGALVDGLELPGLSWRATSLIAGLLAMLLTIGVLLLPSAQWRLTAAAAVGTGVLVTATVWRFNPQRFWHRLLSSALAAGFGAHALGFSFDAVVAADEADASFTWSGGVSWAFSAVWALIVVVLTVAASRSEERQVSP